MKIVLLTFYALLLTGCTSLLVREPIGTNFTPEQLKSFEGEWLLHAYGEKPIITELKKVDDDGCFRVAYMNWDADDQEFELNQSEVILKQGEEYGILHFKSIDGSDIPNDLLLITLFEVNEGDEIVYWITKTDEAKEFLDASTLEKEEVDGEIVIVDTSERIVKELEINRHIIFDTNSSVTLTKIVQQVRVSND